MKVIKILLCSLVVSLFGTSVNADDYVIDVNGAHAFVQFKAQHLGYSYLYGRFNTFDGKFTYDSEDDTKNSVWMTVDMSSVDSNHSERDKHLRGKKFFNVDKFPEAKFVSRAYKTVSAGKAKLTGDLTLMGVTKKVVFDVKIIGGGRDPWGGYRQGFEARTLINTKDFGMSLPKKRNDIELVVSVEGCKSPNKGCNSN